MVSGRSRFDLLKEMTALRYGAGRLAFEEYFGLRLFDPNLYGNADKKAFVGAYATQQICLQANYRCDFFGLVNNKVAADILLGMYGFPVMPTIAVFRDQVGRPAKFLLRSEVELREFLTKNEHYPLFCKPISGHQSIGTASLERYDVENHSLISTVGHAIPFDTFIGFVKAHSASGYLFQARVRPHAKVREICGDRLATIRLITIVSDGAPKLLHACWKIPAGINFADNYWRTGNLLAQIDLGSGQVLRVIRGTSNGFEEITHHPDTNAQITGTSVPNWQEITSLALEGAKAFEQIPLAGWDIAPVDAGAVIVEINEMPDFKLHQLAERRGVLDDDLAEFIEERKQHAAEWKRQVKQKHVFITELVAKTPPIPNTVRSLMP